MRRACQGVVRARWFGRSPRASAIWRLPIGGVGVGVLSRRIREAAADAAYVFKASVDGFGGSIAGAGAVEVGKDVSGSLFEGAAEFGDLDQGDGHADGEGVDELDHQLTPGGAVLVPFAAIIR